MPIAENHAERVAGLSRMAAVECEGDLVAAFAALLDAAGAMALAAEIHPATARRRLERVFRTSISGVEAVETPHDPKEAPE